MRPATDYGVSDTDAGTMRGTTDVMEDLGRDFADTDVTDTDVSDTGCVGSSSPKLAPDLALHMFVALLSIDFLQIRVIEQGRFG